MIELLAVVGALLAIVVIAELVVHRTAPHALSLEFRQNQVLVRRDVYWPRNKYSVREGREPTWIPSRLLLVVDQAAGQVIRGRNVVCSLRQVRFVEVFNTETRSTNWQIDLGYEEEGEGRMSRVLVDRGATNAPSVADKLARCMGVSLRR